MENCLHPVQMHGLCAVCGVDLTESNYSFENNLTINSQTQVSSTTESPTLHILHTTPHIKVTPQEAARIGNENMHRLLKGRRLSLVVDLDQTVLHATVDANVHEWIHDPKHPNHIYTQDIHKVALHDSPHIYYIKLRPGLEHFFQQLSKLYELHVYTMGSRSYAHAVVKLFDPDSRLFQDRILSRDDSEIMENRKKLTRIFPTDDRMVVVIDDRSDVWPDCPNLIQVPAYSFFLGTGDINNPFTLKQQQTQENIEKSTLVLQEESSQLDEEAGVQHRTESTVLNPNDNELITIEKVLTKIHMQFYDQYEKAGVGTDTYYKQEQDQEQGQNQESFKLPDVKLILTEMKRSIFSGISFAFSGVLSKNSSYEDQLMWRVSKEFGGRCEEEISDETTHLITNRNDTEKVLEAVARGNIFILKPEWIFNSIRRWRRESEDCQDYKIEETLQNNYNYHRHKNINSKKRKFEDHEVVNFGEVNIDAENSDIVDSVDSVDSVDVNCNFETLLDANDFEEINKELEDLESTSATTTSSSFDSDDTDFSDDEEDFNDHKKEFSDVNISSEEFSDLLDSIENEGNSDFENDDGH